MKKKKLSIVTFVLLLFVLGCNKKDDIVSTATPGLSLEAKEISSKIPKLIVVNDSLKTITTTMKDGTAVVKNLESSLDKKNKTKGAVLFSYPADGPYSETTNAVFYGVMTEYRVSGYTHLGLFTSCDMDAVIMNPSTLENGWLVTRTMFGRNFTYFPEYVPTPYYSLRWAYFVSWRFVNQKTKEVITDQTEIVHSSGISI